MPLTVAVMLGILQLAQIQQARLMTEYAAFQAARAGIVWGGNNERMHDAALVALLPTFGRCDDWAHLGSTWQAEQKRDAALATLGWGASAVTEINGTTLVGLVRVDTVSPNDETPSDFALWNLAGGTSWHELDFDGPDTWPQVPGLESHVARLYDLSLEDAAQDAFRRNTLLQIRVRYWYELRVPFANQLVFLAWFAANANVSLYGAIDRSSTTHENMLGRDGDASAVERLARGIGTQHGYPTVVPSELEVLWALSTGTAAGFEGRRFFLPLSASESMRMQSAFHRKWIMPS